MLLQLITVSRKTPGDGRLEIAPEVARRLGVVPAPLALRVGDAAGEVSLMKMVCTCEAGGRDGPHGHYFLVSALFRELEPAQTVTLELTEGDAKGRMTLVVSRAHPL